MLVYRTGSSVIVGSMHFLAEGTAALVEPELHTIAIGTDRIMVESVAPPDYVPPLAFFPSGQSLATVVPPDLYEATRKRALELGFEESEVARWKPWWAESVLSTRILEGAGYRREFGMEALVYKMAKSSRRPLATLERYDVGFECLDRAPLAEQVWGLELAALRPHELLRKTESLTQHWLEASPVGFLEDLEESSRHQPDAIDCSIRCRTLAWLHLIDRELRKGHVLVLVGSLHLVSATGLIALLQVEGYKFEP